MARRRIDLDCDKIADLYLSGKSAAEIGAIFGVSQSPILIRLRESGVKIRNKGGIRDITEKMNLGCNKIANLYLSGKSAKEIGKISGVSPKSILRRLRKSGIKIRGGRETRDIFGKRFGRLVAIYPEKKRKKDGAIVWLCKCDCGNTTSVAARNLHSGRTCSCGCLNREATSRVGKDTVIDITGQRFGRWLVLNRAPNPNPESRHGAFWLCKCDCGTVKSVEGTALRSGKSMSCGCLQAEKVAIMLSERRGAKHPMWNPNKTNKERQEERSYPEYGEWREAVFKRDNYTCQKCGEKGGRLCAHHIESYDVNKKLRTALENGVTLCKKHHDDFHHQFGRGNNTREQFEQFLSEGKG